MDGEFEEEDISEAGDDREEELSELQRRRILLCGKYGLIKSAVSRLAVQKDDIEDLAQDIFLIAYSRIDQLRQIGSIDSWLYKITGRYVRKHLRNFREKANKELSWDGETGGASVKNQSSGDWERMCAQIEYEDLMFFLKRLEATEQTILSMRYLKGFSLVEISEILNMNYNTVKTVKFRALKKLRRMLEEDENRVAKRNRSE